MIGFISPQSGLPLKRSGDFLISANGERYPVQRGIPRFVSADNYAAAFGLEWQVHAVTQLDSQTKVDISKERLERCLGMPLGDLRGKTVLEAGGGAGRFTELLVRAGALVHTIDLSLAVEANKDNIGDRENYVIAQADIQSPPFPRATFDFVICLGVLQHTPSPEVSIRALWAMAKPGGFLIVDHYTWNLSRVTKLASVYRLFLRRMPPAKAQRIVERLVDVFFPLHWTVRRFRPAQMLLSRVSPCQVYFHSLPQLSKQQHRDFCRLDTFDHLTDYYKHLRTPGQLRRFLEKLNAQNLWVARGGNGVEVRGQKLKVERAV